MKKSVVEILALPEWERRIWRDVFDIYGPLDWKRNDFLFAHVNQFQTPERIPLKEFILFRDPTAQEPKRTEDDVLREFGYTGE